MSSKAIQLRSRWRRNSRLLRLGARVGLGHAGTSARKVFAGAERKEQLSRSRELKSAQQVADELGNMKGALMKVGQMAATLTMDFQNRCAWPCRNCNQMHHQWLWN